MSEMPIGLFSRPANVLIFILFFLSLFFFARTLIGDASAADYIPSEVPVAISAPEPGAASNLLDHLELKAPWRIKPHSYRRIIPSRMDSNKAEPQQRSPEDSDIAHSEPAAE